MFNNNYIFFVMSLIVALLAFVIIPKKEYKHYILFGMVFGGIGEVVAVTFLTFIGLIKYKEMGVFSIFGFFPFWTPLTGMFLFMIFFYLLPVRKVFLIPYLLSFSALNYGTGLLLKQTGLFYFPEIYLYIAPFVSMLWYSLAAYVYFKDNGLELR